MSDLGKRIRTERLNQQLTLEQLAKKTNLSKSFLSQIERGTGQPSITSLKKIAIELGISVVKLFPNKDNGQEGYSDALRLGGDISERLPYANSVRIVPADRRKRLALPGSKIVYELLTPDMKRPLEVLYMSITPGEHSGDKSIIDAEGDKFGVVLKGALEIRIEDDVYKLEAGDSIYFPANFAHSWRGLEGEKSIEVIWVFTPPCF
jgi:transcriptional regulator with XRE-family HTH domain